ncbi:low-density lipoprotein receptor-related protein 8-like [Clinocottus analis]|uniref:low-density lipoprotein receptor-related protein 8-like n=1 Tax=Clinocottus analis TaxID=304258 RepID=UPI0035C1DAB3
MGHLAGLFLLLTPLSWCPFRVSGAAVRPLPACHQQLEFRCSDGLCIPRPSVCDGHADCEDGSDEQHCGPFSCRKASGSFSCGPSDVCLPENKLCDGRSDCRDGRDEAPRLCSLSRPRPQNSPACAASEFRCGDGQCVRHSWRCDHSPDCSDGSDEDDCDQNECRVNNGGCSHQCVDLPLGFHCDCPDNMRLVGDSQCEDVDQCLESDVCDQLCVHTNGSLTCRCNEDYRMNPTTRECKAKGDEAQLVFTSSRGIGWISITGSESREPAPHVLGPGPVAALASNRTLYWAGRGSVYRVSVDGKTEDSELVLTFQGSASGLAVDWIHQLLYWTSTESASVSVGLLDGSAQRRLITGLDHPSAVAVDPLQGLLFWAQCGIAPKIERASLDGSDRTALVVSSLRRPVALSLDMPRQLLYWADQGMRSISRVNLEGRHRKTVVESNGYLDRPFGLAVFEGFVYWSEEATRSVCRASKHNGANLRVLLSNVSSPGGVVVVQPVLQPKGPSECGQTGTVCVHGCVVHLLTESLKFSCIPSDATFAGILALIVFLSVLLVGLALWWWREEFRPIKSLTEQSFSLKESQDPLIMQAPHTGPNTCLIKETLLKLHLDGE